MPMKPAYWIRCFGPVQIWSTAVTYYSLADARKAAGAIPPIDGIQWSPDGWDANYPGDTLKAPGIYCRAGGRPHVVGPLPGA